MAALPIRIRVFTSFSVLGTMLSSVWIASLFPGEKLIFALAGVTLLPAFVAAFAAVKLKHPHVRGPSKSTLTREPAQLLLAAAFIGAAALIQASHAQYYSFMTLRWKTESLSPGFVGAAWATGVAAESVLFPLAARYFSAERNADVILIICALGAMIRWLAMSAGPRALFLIVLAAMHGLSFGATYFGSVLLLSGMAQETHRARMQSWLASASALSLALSTFACGRLTRVLGEEAYLAMAALAAAGLMLALFAKAMTRKWTHARYPQSSGGGGWMTKPS